MSPNNRCVGGAYRHQRGCHPDRDGQATEADRQNEKKTMCAPLTPTKFNRVTTHKIIIPLERKLSNVPPKILKNYLLHYKVFRELYLNLLQLL